MGQTNDKRISRSPSLAPDYSRDDTVRSSLNELFEEDLGAGYSEITYISNVFASKIETWIDNTKAFKRTETNITYAPFPFVGIVIKDFYMDDGITIHFKVTATLLYNANKTVNSIDVQRQKLAGP